MVLSKKQKQNRNILVGILIVIGVIFLINAGKLPFFAVGGVPPDLETDYGEGGCAGGFTTLSTSQVSISVEEGVAGQERIKITGIPEGSECNTITLSQSLLDEKLKNEGFDATKDIILNTELISFSQTFPITKQGDFNGVGTNKVIDKSGRYGAIDSLKSCTPKNSETYRKCLVDWCKNIAQEPSTIYAYKVDWASKVRCVLGRDYGDYGVLLGEANADFSIKVTIGSESKYLSRTDQTATFSDGHFVQFAGGILEGLDTLDFVGYNRANLVGGQWQLIEGDISLFNSAVTDFKTNMNSKMSGASPYVSDNSYDTFFTSFSNKISFINDFKTQEFENTLKGSGLIFDAKTDKNNLYVTLKAKKLPLLTYDLVAQKVGIIRLQGKPKITDCIDKQELISGVNKPVTFSVKNDAKSKNVEFYGGIECDGGVSATFPPFQIGAEETKTINLQLQPINLNQEPLKGECTLTVKDKGSENMDSCNFDTEVGYNSGRGCTPNELFCLDNNIQKCDADGKDWSLSSKCSGSCSMKKGTAECLDLEGGEQNATCVQEGQQISKDQICCAGLEKKGGFLGIGDTCEKTLPECKTTDAWVLSQTLGGIFKKLKCDPKIGQKLAFIPTLIKIVLTPIVFLFTFVLGNGIFRRMFRGGRRQNRGIVLILSLIIASLLAFLFYSLLGALPFFGGT